MLAKLSKESTWTIKSAVEIKSIGDAGPSPYFVTLDENTVAVLTDKEPSIQELADRIRAVINNDRTQGNARRTLAVFVKMMAVYTFNEIKLNQDNNREITEAFVAAMEDYFNGDLK